MRCIVFESVVMLKHFTEAQRIRELNAVMESYLILLGKMNYDAYLFMDLFEEYKDPIHPNKSSLPPQQDSSPFFFPPNSNDNEIQICTLHEYIESHKLKIINYALQQCGDNKTIAAKKLGISTNTLSRIRKKKRYGLKQTTFSCPPTPF